MTYKRWCELIDEARLLDCKRCQFIGGEPFLYKGENNEGVLDLAKYARNRGYEFIEIFTNATLIRNEHIHIIKELDLNLAVSLYSNKPEIHDSITRTQGSHQKTMRSLQRLREADIPTRVATILMRQNQETVRATSELIMNMGFETRSPDVLRPKGRGDNKEIQPDDEYLVEYGFMLEPDFRADLDILIRYSSGHSCLLGKLTITETGIVLPCIFSRSQALGSVRQNSLQKVLESDKLQSIWKTTKDDVLVCRDCEYRYVCFDCRPLSEGAAEGNAHYLHAPYPRCTYNPYTGEWGLGIWKVDNDGQPYYDKSLQPIIQKIKQKKDRSMLTKQQGH